jgi:PAS domain S-box-containing protein
MATSRESAEDVDPPASTDSATSPPDRGTPHIAPTDSRVESAAAYRSLFEASADAILLTDLETRILMCNPQAAVLRGTGSAQELIGRNAFEFIDPRDHARAMANAQRTLETGKVQGIEYTLIRDDGSRFPAELSAALIRDAEGTPQAFTAIVRDITDRKRLESELRQSEKLAALGVMAAGVAHHINNVLARVLGQADLLLETAEEETARARLLTIVEAAQDGAAAVRRIKQFAYEQPTETYERVDLGEVVGDVIAATAPFWPEDATQNRAIEVVAELESVAVFGGPSELREAISHILLNAIDALPGGGEIMVEVAQRENQAVLRVTDTGIGMAEEVLERVYDPFFTTKPLGEGTGLGLAIAYGIVHRHGGRLEVQSHEGLGTTVELLLPLIRPVERADG